MPALDVINTGAILGGFERHCVALARQVARTLTSLAKYPPHATRLACRVPWLEQPSLNGRLGTTEQSLRDHLSPTRARITEDAPSD